MNTSVVWIIGASAGIGRALALELASHGHTLILSARNREALNELQMEIQSRYPQVRSLVSPCDVASRENLAQVYHGGKEAYGNIHTIIFGAGVYTPTPLKLFHLKSITETLTVNLQGALNLYDVVREDIEAKQPLHLAWIGSVAAYRGLPNSLGYGISKAALQHFVEIQRAELDPAQVKVQLISPGFVKTRLTDLNTFEMPFLITPQQAAQAILKGLQSDVFEIHFPKRFTYLMKLLRILPDWIYFNKICPGLKNR